MSSEKALQPADQKARTVRHMLTVSKEQIEMALPKHIQADRLIRVAMTSIQRTPKLLDCDQKSLLAAIMQSAQLGLMPDGVLGEAYLIPFKDQVQFIIGYRGLLSLARRSGEIVSMAAHCVHKNDVFEFEYGLDEKLRHVPNMLEDRGDLVAVYAVAKLRDGGYAVEVMSRKDVEKIRDRSQGYKSAIQYKKDHPWITDFDQMARKTVLRRLSKYLPVSVEMLEAIAVDESTELGKAVTTFDDGRDLLPTKATAEALTDRFTGGNGELIDGATGEVLAGGKSDSTKEAPPPPQGDQQPAVQDAPPQPPQDAPPPPETTEQSAGAVAPVVLKFMKEINQATSGGSVAVDQWRMKHVNRVLRECGGDQNGADFIQVRDYAQMVYDECKRAEDEAAR